ncbi:MAG: sigma-70 family RNA polymerase sigma factor [Rhodothermales bacterium]|nr:sigma-70 family RNA polymerase sigma factor [Rhodothermales bacterium]
MAEDIVIRFLVSHRSHLLAFIRGIVRDRDVADDVYQEVCVSVVLKRDEIEDEDHLRNWCRQAARFKAIDVLRKQNSQAFVMDQAVLDLVEADLTQREDGVVDRHRGALRACLEQLSPYVQELLRLRYGEGLSGVRLAEALDRQVNTVSVALSRAHNTLETCIRTRLADSGDES